MSARRQSLADLVPSPPVSAPDPAVPPPAAAEPIELVKPKGVDASPIPIAEPSEQDEQSVPEPRRRPVKQPAGPKYLQLERKEVRITAGQYDQLTAMARRLNRQRPRVPAMEEGRRERITENTLIRIAIDMLLLQEGQLKGGTEDELRKSVLP